MACCLSPNCCPSRPDSDEDCRRRSSVVRRPARIRSKSVHPSAVQPPSVDHQPSPVCSSSDPTVCCCHCPAGRAQGVAPALSVVNVVAPSLVTTAGCVSLPPASLSSAADPPEGQHQTMPVVSCLTPTGHRTAVDVDRSDSAEPTVDFMTVFFRSCEQIVRDNATLLTDILNIHPDLVDVSSLEESSLSSLSEPQQDPCRLTYDDDDGLMMAHGQSQQLTAAGDSAVQSRLVPSSNSSLVTGCLAPPIVPANSPVTSSIFSLQSDNEVHSGVDAAAEVQLTRREAPAADVFIPTGVSHWRLPISVAQTSRAPVLWSSTDDEPLHQRPFSRTHHALRRLPAGLGSRPPCLGQECSPIRTTPCGAGAGREASSSTTAGTSTSNQPPTVRRVVPAGCRRFSRINHVGPSETPTVTSSTCRHHLRRRRCVASSAVRRHFMVEDADQQSAADPVVQNSCQKVDNWLRLQHLDQQFPASSTEEFQRTPTTFVHSPHTSTDHRLSTGDALKRKLHVGVVDDDPDKVKVKVRRESVVDVADCCSLPSSTFSSDDDEHQLPTGSRLPRTEPTSACTDRQMAAQNDVMSSTPSRHSAPKYSRPEVHCRPGSSCSAAVALSSSGGFADRSDNVVSSTATSSDWDTGSSVEQHVRLQRHLALNRRNCSTRRRDVMRRLSRMARRMHRTAESTDAIHVETLAVL